MVSWKVRVSSAVMTVTPVQTVWLRPAQAGDHGGGLPVAVGLAQDLTIDIDDGIAANDGEVPLIGLLCPYGPGFAQGKLRTASTGPVPGAMASSQSLVCTVKRRVMMERSSGGGDWSWQG